MQKVGFGLVHELAGFDLEFSGIMTPDGESFSLRREFKKLTMPVSA